MTTHFNPTIDDVEKRLSVNIIPLARTFTNEEEEELDLTFVTKNDNGYGFWKSAQGTMFATNGKKWYLCLYATK